MAKVYIFFNPLGPAEVDGNILEVLQHSIRASLEKTKNAPFVLDRLNVTKFSNYQKPAKPVSGGFLAINITAGFFIIIIVGTIIYSFYSFSNWKFLSE